MYESLANVAPAKELMAKWRHPSLTVHRVEVSGPGNSTVIPSSARATISLRIVPDQTSEEVGRQLVEFLKGRYRGGNKLEVKIEHTSEPWLGEYGNEAFQTLEAAVERAWFSEESEGVEPKTNGVKAKKGKVVYIREGGSIPGLRFLEEVTGARAAHLPCGQRSDAAHLDNERLRVVNLFKVSDVRPIRMEGMCADVMDRVKISCRKRLRSSPVARVEVRRRRWR